MISLSAPTYDPSGYIAANGHASQQPTGRRASRVATLDGAARLVDGGYSTSDLTFSIVIPDPDGSHHRTIARLMQYHATALLTCSRGAYSVLLSNLTSDNSGNAMTTRVTAEVLEVA